MEKENKFQEEYTDFSVNTLRKYDTEAQRMGCRLEYPRVYKKHLMSEYIQVFWLIIVWLIAGFLIGASTVITLALQYSGNI